MSRAARAAERLAGWLWPRRCPLCGALLGPDAADRLLCPRCAPAAAALAQTPPRLPEGAYAFYALSGAAAAFRYEGPVRRAILRCKGRGEPWYARELADLMWASLNEENKVSLFVRYVDLMTGSWESVIINKHE